MPFFVAKPPRFEARAFYGGTESALDVQGWLLSNGVPTDHVDVGTENERIVWADKELKVGEWALLQPNAGTVEVKTAQELFQNYTPISG